MGFRKVIALILSICMALSLVACQPASTGTSPAPASGSANGANSQTADTPASTQDKPDPVKIAVFIATSGSLASSAVFQIQAMDLVVKQINENGGIAGLGGADIELVYCDTMSDTTQMKTVVENSLSDPEIAFALFPLGGPYTLASMAAITKSKVPSLATANSDSIYEQGCDYIYGTGQLSSRGVSLTFDYCDWLASEYNLDTAKVGIVCVDNEYGKTNAEAFKERLEKKEGYSIAYYSLYPAAISDMSSIVTALKTNDAQILYYSGFEQDAKLFFNTMAMMNYNPVVIGGGSGLLFPTYADALGDDVVGLVSSSMGNSNTATAKADPDYAKVVEECYELYGHEGGDYMLCYDTFFKIIVSVLNETKTIDREINNSALKSMEFETLYTLIDEDGNPTTKLKFDERGTSPRSILTMVQYKATERGNFPVCIYPEAYATAELQFGTGIK